MIFHQFYLGCLAHASYLIGDGGEAAIVDPQRDVDQYIQEAEKLGLTIRWILETHLHADFVSGHRELAERTGAAILIGAKAGAEFQHRPVHQGDTIELGSIDLRALETPGHTPESISWLVLEDARPVKVLTGDTLFIGDVGRPDLAGGKGYTPVQMAEMLYDSLHSKLLALPDHVEVWPAHGAGSACGKNLSKERSSTIGEQRRLNYALRPMSRQEFVTMLTNDLDEAPRYFPRDAEINRRGARPLSEVQAPRLDVAAFGQAMSEGALVLDVRQAPDFGEGHIAGSINIGLDGQFASWCGTLLPPDQPLLIVADGDAKIDEAVMRLARVGMENVAGALQGGIASWPRAELVRLPQITPIDAVASRLPILDVRRIGEFTGGHATGSQHIPLHELERRLHEVRTERPLAIVCGGGYRSSAAASLLERAGLRDLVNVAGGMAAWRREGLAVVTD